MKWKSVKKQIGRVQKNLDFMLQVIAQDTMSDKKKRKRLIQNAKDAEVVLNLLRAEVKRMCPIDD